MAVLKIFPSKDSTIYSDKPDMNTGLDEILELQNISGYRNSTSRILMKFEGLSKLIENMDPTISYSFNLKLFLAYASNLKENININILPIIGVWENGTGKINDTVQINSGVSWDRASADQYWTPGGPYNSNIQNKYNIGANSTKDINADITSLINNIISSPIDNGFLIKLDDEYEFNNNKGNDISLKFFSKDTHTIYSPHIEFKWDDSIYNNLAELDEITDSENYIAVSNNKGEFYEDSINKFRVNVRPLYPKRKYKITSVYTDNYILPENACYSIKDVKTNESIIDFDNIYTKLSCDGKGNYFNLNMYGFQPERYYKILIKYNIGDEEVIYDNKLYFKVKRNINNPVLPDMFDGE